MILTKKKVSKKHYPPDTQAAKMLLELTDSDHRVMTDEQIHSELIRLLKEYQGELNEKDNN